MTRAQKRKVLRKSSNVVPEKVVAFIKLVLFQFLNNRRIEEAVKSKRQFTGQLLETLIYFRL